MTDNTYNNADVLAMEHIVLHNLDFTLTALTPLRILEFIRMSASRNGGKYPPTGTPEAHIEGLCKGVWFLASFLCELSLTEYAEVCTTPSVLAAAALILAVHTYEVLEESADNDYSTHTNANSVGDAGPAVCAMADMVWATLGTTLHEDGDIHELMERVGVVVTRMHVYFSKAQPLFATCRKYSLPKRMRVSMVQCCPQFKLPWRVRVCGVDAKLCGM